MGAASRLELSSAGDVGNTTTGATDCDDQIGSEDTAPDARQNSKALEISVPNTSIVSATDDSGTGIVRDLIRTAAVSMAITLVVLAALWIRYQPSWYGLAVAGVLVFGFIELGLEAYRAG